MRFLDPNINLLITNKTNGDKLKFKAYLEKSDITFTVQESNFEYIPVGYGSVDSYATRLLYTLDLSFNVFSENREEAISNYQQLHRLIEALKPGYTIIEGSYLPTSDNAFGNISINFKGLPKINKKSDSLDIATKTFSYNINQEMGFIEVPYDNADKKTFRYFDTGMRLIPIAFKIGIGGRISVNFEDTVKLTGASAAATAAGSTGPGSSGVAAPVSSLATNIVALEPDNAKRTQLLSALKEISGLPNILNLPENKIIDSLKHLKRASDSAFIDLQNPNSSPNTLVVAQYTAAINRIRSLLASP
jgi:hypothetical protein